MFGFDAVFDGGSEEFVHFDHGAADEAGDSAAAGWSIAGFVAEVFDGGEDERDRQDDEHREGREQKEEDLEGHVASEEHGRRHAESLRERGDLAGV